MDREILFRGKRIDNGECVEGFYAQTDIGTFIVQYNVDCELEATLMTDYEVDPNTVCQYTGLKDKNGKKIFEHDRIKYKCGDIAEVIFTEYGAFVGETESLSHENIGGVLTEVIGTVFDNEADNG